MTQGEGAGAEPPAVVRVRLGKSAPWLGPGVYALAALVYLATVVFETYAVANRPSLGAISMAPVGAAEFSWGEYTAHVEWRASVFLLVGAVLAAALVALFAFVRSAREAPLPSAAILVLGVAAAVIAFGLIDREHPTAVMAQVSRLLESSSTNPQVGRMGALAVLIKRCAEGVAWLVGLGAASLVALPTIIDAKELAHRIRVLRALFYTSAVLFVVSIMMTEAAYSWLVSFFSAGGDVALESVVSAGTLSAGAYYTLMLAAIYLPAAAALGYVGRRLADAATETSPEADAATWLEGQGLAVSWRGQLARIATLVAPLVSSAVAGVLRDGG